MENNNLTLGSLFDGSGGFPLGGLISGITPVWASEIEPFPIRVTTKRLPQVKHHGDISSILYISAKDNGCVLLIQFHRMTDTIRFLTGHQSRTAATKGINDDCIFLT